MTYLHKHKRTKIVSDNGQANYFVSKWGLPKLKCYLCSYEHKALNIQYGNGAFVVVREC